MSTSAAGAAAVLLTAGIIVPFFFFLLITRVTVVRPEEADEPGNGYRKIGVSQSRTNAINLNRTAHKPRPGQPPELQSLFIYPLKSCRGIELTRSRVLPTGLEFDRLYTFAQQRETAGEGQDPSTRTWEFLTQRQLPLLANVEVELWLPVPRVTGNGAEIGEGAEDKGGIIVVQFPWAHTGLTGLVQWAITKLTRGYSAHPKKKFMLPVNFPSEETIKTNGYEYETVRIWKETTLALNLSSEVPLEIKSYLGMQPDRPLGLFRMDPSRQREVFRCAPTKETAGYQPVIDFHDALAWQYPLHLMSLNSMWDFESMMLKDDTVNPLDVRRFRSNMIISRAEAYDEETWRKISFSHDFTGDEKSLFDVSCRTVRQVELN
ncbi:MOSC domain protein [Geosmithia morbida]|uniref:MOSC domain protein n=1 Tax=Geosmithia morbida TaxID=1094350 RepID=A0A9P4Z230_9HYPO|nr:MOSC domain protein [Geosmithia morbida]KAF4126732.1 MOSC domain protein [Geosmithia morbida]